MRASVRRVAAVVLVVAVLVGAGVVTAVALGGRSPRGHALPQPRPEDVRASGTVSVFPTPGTLAASPETTISFRGAAPAAVRAIAVDGTSSGAHTGAVLAHSDGGGASFVPSAPFAPGERVTVRTSLAVRDAHDGQFTFTVARPVHVDQDPSSPHAPPNQPASTRPPPSYVTRPDLHPPSVDVVKDEPGTAPGDVFVTPGSNDNTQDGPLILDDRGEPVWFHPLTGARAYDFEAQRYRGEPVLTWFEGTVAQGYGRGVDVIVDDTYHEIATVHAGNGYDADLHEFRITARDTALLTIYAPVLADLSSIGGPKSAPVIDCVVQEVDIPTGAVLFEWHTLGSVAPSESYEPLPHGDEPYDYVHVNSIDVDRSGDLLVSGRHTSSVFDVDRVTGTLVSRLGGKQSNYSMGPGARFAWQHDVRTYPDGTLTVFDNGGSAGHHTHRQSRGLVLRVDEQHRRVTLVHQYVKPQGSLSESQGSFQPLPGGDLFAGWGNQPEYTEFASDGHVRYDVLLPAGATSYRAFRFAWTGHPSDPPRVAATGRAGQVTVYASWNGATAVARWDVLAGDTPAAMHLVASGPRTGFETAITAPATARDVEVRAVDTAGNVLGTSAVMTVVAG